tara:strand:+ start:6539 stop:7315 length:777 start_codon:yes stop_codon:yes gene_type:complete
MIFDAEVYKLGLIANMLSYISGFYIRDANLGPRTQDIMTEWGSDTMKSKIKAFKSTDAFYQSGLGQEIKNAAHDLYPMFAFLGGSRPYDDNKNFFMALRVCGLLPSKAPGFSDLKLHIEALDFVQTLEKAFPNLKKSLKENDGKIGLFLTNTDDKFYQMCETRTQMITADLECKMDCSYNAPLMGCIGWLDTKEDLETLRREYPKCRFISSSVDFPEAYFQASYAHKLESRIRRAAFAVKHKQMKKAPRPLALNRRRP